MSQCIGRTKTFRRCRRELRDSRLFCQDHRYQPYSVIFVFIFTVVAGSVSIFSAFFGTPGSEDLSRKVQALERLSAEEGRKHNQFHHDVDQLKKFFAMQVQSLQADIPLDREGLDSRADHAADLSANVNKTLRLLEDQRANPEIDGEVVRLRSQITEMRETLREIERNTEVAVRLIKEGKSDELLDLELTRSSQKMAIGKIEIQGPEGLTLQSIDSSSGSTVKIYLANKHDEFIRDAKEAARGGVPKVIRSRTPNADRTCTGLPGGCTWIEIEQQNEHWESSRLLKIQWHTERTQVSSAGILNGFPSTILETSYKQSGLNLCDWYELARLSATTGVFLSGNSGLLGRSSGKPRTLVDFIRLPGAIYR